MAGAASKGLRSDERLGEGRRRCSCKGEHGKNGRGSVQHHPVCCSSCFRPPGCRSVAIFCGEIPRSPRAKEINRKSDNKHQIEAYGSRFALLEETTIAFIVVIGQ